jgi:glycosyltransferase involved in cell wall biosynthesis
MGANQGLTLPRVGVVIPTFDRWPYVREAVESVLAQTYPNVQCMVVDDASTDGTSSFLRSEYGQKIRLLTKEKNGEKSAARNEGITATQADFVCFLDSDDLLTPDSVEARMRIFLEDPGFDGVVYGPVTDEQDTEARAPWRGPWPEGDVLAAYVRRRFVRNPGFLVSVANMRRCGMYREDLTHREDVELLIRLSARLEFRCCRTTIARIRRVDRSARLDHAKYLLQGDRVVRYIRSDPFLVERLESGLALLEFDENKELARASYLASDFSGFRRRYLGLWRQWPGWMWLEGRFLRRFVLSCLRRDSHPIFSPRR